MTLTYGSLFSGIGGIDLGLDRAGMECKWQVEIDDYATRVLEKHWPDVPKHRDVRYVGAANLVPVDLICGGFPCQDISAAGRGDGISGERSGLWSEFYRIICELRPRYVFVENVSALLGRGLDVVLGNLAEVGYDAEWNCIPASAVGAPHRRERIWIVAYAQEQHQRAGLCAGQSSTVGWGRSGNGSGSNLLADTTLLGMEGNGTTRLIVPPAPIGTRLLGRYSAGPGADQWSVEPNVGRMAHGIPNRVDRLKGLGNAVVPQLAEWLGRRIVEDAS